MRLTVLAFAFLPVAVHAQETTITIPTEPVAQSQTCPAGMVWDSAANACDMPAAASRPVDMMGKPHGCSGNAAREVTS